MRLGVRSQLLSTQCDRRNLLLTITVCCVDNSCGMTPESKRGGPAFYRSNDILVVLENLSLCRCISEGIETLEVHDLEINGVARILYVTTATKRRTSERIRFAPVILLSVICRRQVH